MELKETETHREQTDRQRDRQVQVCLPEALPCSSSGQQTRMQAMRSSQAIVSVVTESEWLRLYKPADLLSHHKEDHLHPSSSSSSMSSPVCPGGTTSPRPRFTEAGNEACRAVIGQEDLWITDDGGQRSATVTPSHLRTR